MFKDEPILFACVHSVWAKRIGSTKNWGTQTGVRCNISSSEVELRDGLSEEQYLGKAYERYIGDIVSNLIFFCPFFGNSEDL